MITQHEHLDYDQFSDLFSSGSQQSERVAALPEQASHAPELVREIKSHAHPERRGHEGLASELLERGQESDSESNGSPSAAVIQDLDLRNCLESWRYDPSCNVRIGRGADGRPIILVRQPMGLQQFEMDGPPDGTRLHGEETLLQFHQARLDAARREQPEMPFELNAAECEELLREASALNHRLVILFHVKDWTRVKRDAAEIFCLLEFVRRHACCVKDRVVVESWRPHISRIEFVANAMAQPDERKFGVPCQSSRDAVSFAVGLEGGRHDVPALVRTLMENVHGKISPLPPLHSHDDCDFRRQDDFWTIRYHGQSAFLKSNKGLECLASLLRSPGREYHVSELVGCYPEERTSSRHSAPTPRNRPHGEGRRVMAGFHDGTPILDFQAKAECKRRLDDLRDQEEEAERFNDPDRAAKARAEINAIARYLATATGLGGRDRKASSEAERARCAVTKRIKQAIQKIAAAIPALGHHLTARVKTGYFCSYNPHPERPVEWKF